MIPYRDENPTMLTPIVTVGIIVLNVVAWLFVEGLGSRAPWRQPSATSGSSRVRCSTGSRRAPRFEMGPGLFCAVDPVPHYWTVVTSMFMHGGWMHLIGNMWFFWVFGNNIEDAMGHTRFAIFYLICGVAAAAAQTFLNQSSRDPDGRCLGRDQRRDGRLPAALPAGAGACAAAARLLSSPPSRYPPT